MAWSHPILPPMRIALFSSTVDVRNGYGNITVEYCRELRRKGIDFTLFLPASERRTAEALEWDVPTEFVLPRYAFRFSLLTVWMYLRRVDVRAFDVVHSLLDFPYCVIAARSARKYGKPFLMGSQGTYGVVPLTRQPDRFFLMNAYRTARHILVPSRFTREMILRYAKQELPIDIVHNGVNLARFSRDVDATELRRSFGNRKVLLTVGGLKARKGQDLVIRALALLKKDYPELLYVVVGDGHTRPGLEQLAKDIGVSDLVRFTGSKTGDELLRYFRACDVYVHTPRVENLTFEGFGIVYLEASACGKPIVATDAGGVSDAVIDGKTGIVVRDGDVPAIAAAIAGLFKDPALAARMGEEGKRYAAAHDWSMIVERFIAFYRALV